MSLYHPVSVLTHGALHFIAHSLRTSAFEVQLLRCVFTNMCIYKTCFATLCSDTVMRSSAYGVAIVSRIDTIIRLFCRISSRLQGSFAKETYNLIDPTNWSHPICVYTRRGDIFAHNMRTRTKSRRFCCRLALRLCATSVRRHCGLLLCIKISNEDVGWRYLIEILNQDCRSRYSIKIANKHVE